MAREGLTASLAAFAKSMPATWALFIFCIAQAHAQTPDRQDCVTRTVNGMPQVFCTKKESLAPQKSEKKMHSPDGIAPMPSTAAQPTFKGFGAGVGAPRKPAGAGMGSGMGTGMSVDTMAVDRPSPIPGSSGKPPNAALRPVRALIEPADMPPRGVAGYGIVAFTTRSLPQNNGRDKFVCEAFKAALVAQDELPSGTPLTEQMVTFWPVLNKSTPQALKVDCAHLIENYALQLGLDAIADADKLKERLATRRGPFLIAWAPSESCSKQDAVVLVMDLSSIDSQSSFVEVFQDWRQKIVDNPQLWTRGFDVASLRRTIRDTFDRYGEGLVRLIKSGS